MDSLEEIAALVRSCNDCPLGRGRSNAVPGEGPADAEIMFIGEGPGFQEDRQGRPFVGPAGQFLEGLLASIGMRREDVFIANMVKCRPPQNRDPAPAEISTCRKYLDRQIELVDPRLIVTLGRFSLGRFFPGESISRARGRARPWEGRLIYPVMHPAAGLRRQEMRSSIIQDFKAIPEALDQAYRLPTAEEPPETPAEETPQAQPPETPEEAPPTQQLNLF